MNRPQDQPTDDRRAAHSPRDVAADGRGRSADHPGEIPRAGYKDIALRLKDEIKDDRVGLVAAGVAFYGMLALFPAITALISAYGLVADPAEIQTQVEKLAGGFEGQGGQLIVDQAQAIASTGSRALSIGLIVSLVAALWTASSGMHGLMQALTVANDEPETRGFLERRATALVLTLMTIVVVLLAVGVIVVVPIVLSVVRLEAVGELLVRIARWPLFALVVAGVLGVIYRYGPDRDEPQWRWVSTGAIVATVLWVLASVGFSLYVSNFGSYNETYGALGAVIVLMLWLFLSAFIVLVGAELNAEMEHQTARDTTVGEPRPMGQRDAQVADHVGERHR